MPVLHVVPGVYVEEQSGAPRSIQGVPTSVTAFVGFARRGPTNRATRLLSLTDFEHRFGGLHPGSELGYAVRQFFLNGGREALVVRLPGRLARSNAQIAPPVAAYDLVIGDRAARRGLHALDTGFNILCLPGISDPDILRAASAYCAERRAFLILDPPRAAGTPNELLGFIHGLQLPAPENAAAYYPWLQILDPLAPGTQRLAPPGGTIAGLYARCDDLRGVWKAPAGSEATLHAVAGLARIVTDTDSAAMVPHGVNPIRVLPGVGPVAWGARTLRGGDESEQDLRYVPVRRLALYIEESIDRGTHWVVFEPNDEPLWARIRHSIETFMHDLWREGAFLGRTPAEAYLVRCDAGTTTQNDQTDGVVNILIGFAPLKPAEFVMLRIRQRVAKSQ